MERALRVLFIEDDPNDAELIARKLRGGGFALTFDRVEHFGDVRLAIAQGGYDLILSDHSMPGFRSADVLDLLKHRSGAPPLIIVSGAIGEDEVVDALHRGAKSYVDKNALARLVPMVERVLADEELRRRHELTVKRLELVQAAVESTADVILILELETAMSPHLVYANEAAYVMTGYDDEELAERGFGALFSNDVDPTAVERLVRAMGRGDQAQAELQLAHRNGTKRWVETSIRPIAEGSQRFVCVSRDITERRNHERQLAFLARHDPLTGLPNRAYLDERLPMEFATSRRTNQPFALMLVDVDHFKEINDKFGHACGDEVLRAVGGRLRSCVREIDTVTRLGGDEFVVLLTAIGTIDFVTGIADRALRALREPVMVDGVPHDMSASIGVAISSDGADKKSMMRDADAALYRVKAAGRNGFSF